MKLYHISDRYCDYLRQYDAHVYENKSGHRPYIGVVIDLGDIKYYAPMTSPKPKHLKMRNGKDFIKLGNGKYGAINFNNMVPVPDSELALVEIDTETDAQYRSLLTNQYMEILDDEKRIIKTATNLRAMVFADVDALTEFDQNIVARCCNLPLLERLCRDYRA